MGHLPVLDCARVAPKLWMGSAPPVGRTVSEAGFRAVAFCAREYQLHSRELRGIIVIHAGIDDSETPTTVAEVQTALEASFHVARLVSQQQRTLVTCWQGRNRSGLVTALALHRLYGWSADDCVDAVRTARHRALERPAFVEAVAAFARGDLSGSAPHSWPPAQAVARARRSA